MKFIFILLTSFLSLVSPVWLTNLEQAKTEAKAKQKLILLNFSGSDWCVPCIKLERGIFETEEFKNYAADKLVLVKADFPRLKKNQLAKEQQALNDALKKKYNQIGAFPLTLLLDANGNVLKQWDGIPASTPNDFISKLSNPAK
ncbi:thioredoxin family protein [Adhaeribacter rhizoryzae]|uniref:Thioredoxin family protein n=1 Tax=Adhaeribacter rhizoryzae TaxID=2607907 RepID=A0A5M6DKJ0_9BACT|nr:thioredoxin family protein [Adhaeribacter rhizoryzae]KAA5546802.1 thioredoxin family protein [Adhaeribacter rhizoryzae]